MVAVVDHEAYSGQRRLHLLEQTRRCDQHAGRETAQRLRVAPRPPRERDAVAHAQPFAALKKGGGQRRYSKLHRHHTVPRLDTRDAEQAREQRPVERDILLAEYAALACATGTGADLQSAEVV